MFFGVDRITRYQYLQVRACHVSVMMSLNFSRWPLTLAHHKPTLEPTTKNRPHLFNRGPEDGKPNRDRSRNETPRPSAHELPGYTELASGVDARHNKKG